MKNYFLYLIFLIILIFSDLGSKQFIKSYFKGIDSEYLLQTSFLDIKNLCNSGVSFGIMNSISSTYVKILTFMILIILLIYFYRTLKKNSFEVYFGIMIVAGAMANLIDRTNNNCVYDFIDIHFYDYHWYVFNLADSYITVGAILLIVINEKKF